MIWLTTAYVYTQPNFLNLCLQYSISQTCWHTDRQHYVSSNPACWEF